jgi:preprotein translocase subunit SecG
MTVFLYVAMTAFISICVILVALILIQKGRGGGLASAFGGAGGQTAFGSKTGDVLTWATSIVFAIFVVLAVVLNLIANHIDAHPTAATVTPISANLPAAPASPTPAVPPLPQSPAGPTPMNTTPPTMTPPNMAPSNMAPSNMAPTSTLPSIPSSANIPTTMPTMSMPAHPNTTVPTTLP